MALVFDSLGDVKNYIAGNPSKVKLTNGKTIVSIIQLEAERLAKCIERKIAEYYTSFTPEEYNRTMDLINAVRVSAVVTKENIISAKVYFDDSAIKPSVLGGEDGFTPVLMNYGWSVDSGWHKDIENFGYKPGAKFIESAIEDFQKQNNYGLKVQVSVDAPGISEIWDF